MVKRKSVSLLFCHTRNYRRGPQVCCTLLRVEKSPRVTNRCDYIVISDSQSVWEILYLDKTLERTSILK